MISFIFYIFFFLNNSITTLDYNNVKLLESIEKGKEKATLCATCHNIDGNSIIPMWPKIAGQHAPYINIQLKAFKKNERQNQIMFNIVKDLTESDFTDLSNYFSSQKTTSGVLKNKEKFEKGKILYNNGHKENEIPACSACHGYDARGNEFAGFPKLRSQHAEYIIQQLNNYKTKQRCNDFNGIMQDITIKLNEEQITNIAEYLSSI